MSVDPCPASVAYREHVRGGQCPACAGEADLLLALSDIETDEAVPSAAETVRAMPSGPGRLRRAIPSTPSFLPFHSVRPIATGETVEVVAYAQVPFKGTQLYIPLACGEFDLRDVRVGANSQMASRGTAPAEAFADCCPGRVFDLIARAHAEAVPVCGELLENHVVPVSGVHVPLPEGALDEAQKFGRPFGMQTAQVCMHVALRIRNNGAPLPFRAVVFGDAIID